MNNYNIINISKVNSNLLFEFYKKVFNQRHKTLSKNWQWWYRNKYLGFETLVLIKDQKVIGQAGLIPVKINIKNEILPAIWFVDFAILPKFQRQGFGTILTKEWMKICPNQITFCNNKSLKIFKKFGWKENHNSKRLAKPIDPFKFIFYLGNFKNNFFSKYYRAKLKKKLHKVDTIKPYLVKDNYKILFESFEKRKLFSTDTIVRDQDWLSWRILECPFSRNIHFFENDGNFAITHIVISKNIRRLHILYSFSTNFPNEESLIKSIYKWGVNNSIDLIWGNTNNKELIQKYENVFSSRFTKNLNFASWSSNINPQLSLNDLQAIDSDNDIISIDDNYL
tara:strand:- start:257 stop:1270 length:1014 start_codon:yes stop_codon:yes gene_type:complete